MKSTPKIMELKHPLEEYFKYHPPVTEKRKTLHNRVNDKCLQLFRSFTDPNHSYVLDIEATYDDGMKLLNDVCSEPTCYRWAYGSLIRAKESALLENISSEKIFMHMQQFRMFLNQAVTIQELDNEAQETSK